jgi:hypothetical protein
MTPHLGHAFVMTSHAIDAMTGLCEYQFTDSVMTTSAIQAVYVVPVVSGHDSFVNNGLVTDSTIERTVGADWGAIWKHYYTRIYCHLSVALHACKAVEVEERLSELQSKWSVTHVR